MLMAHVNTPCLLNTVFIQTVERINYVFLPQSYHTPARHRNDKLKLKSKEENAFVCILCFISLSTFINEIVVTFLLRSLHAYG